MLEIILGIVGIALSVFAVLTLASGVTKGVTSQNKNVKEFVKLISQKTSNLQCSYYYQSLSCSIFDDPNQLTQCYSIVKPVFDKLVDKCVKKLGVLDIPTAKPEEITINGKTVKVCKFYYAQIDVLDYLLNTYSYFQLAPAYSDCKSLFSDQLLKDEEFLSYLENSDIKKLGSCIIYLDNGKGNVVESFCFAPLTKEECKKLVTQYGGDYKYMFSSSLACDVSGTYAKTLVEGSIPINALARFCLALEKGGNSENIAKEVIKEYLKPTIYTLATSSNPGILSLSESSQIDVIGITITADNGQKDTEKGLTEKIVKSITFNFDGKKITFRFSPTIDCSLYIDNAKWKKTLEQLKKGFEIAITSSPTNYFALSFDNRVLTQNNHLVVLHNNNLYNYYSGEKLSNTKLYLRFPFNIYVEGANLVTGNVKDILAKDNKLDDLDKLCLYLEADQKDKAQEIARGIFSNLAFVTNLDQLKTSPTMSFSTTTSIKDVKIGASPPGKKSELFPSLKEVRIKGFTIDYNNGISLTLTLEHPIDCVFRISSEWEKEKNKVRKGMKLKFKSASLNQSKFAFAVYNKNALINNNGNPLVLTSKGFAYLFSDKAYNTNDDSDTPFILRLSGGKLVLDVDSNLKKASSLELNPIQRVCLFLMNGDQDSAKAIINNLFSKIKLVSPKWDASTLFAVSSPTTYSLQVYNIGYSENSGEYLPKITINGILFTTTIGGTEKSISFAFDPAINCNNLKKEYSITLDDTDINSPLFIQYGDEYLFANNNPLIIAKNQLRVLPNGEQFKSPILKISSDITPAKDIQTYDSKILSSYLKKMNVFSKLCWLLDFNKKDLAKNLAANLKIKYNQREYKLDSFFYILTGKGFSYLKVNGVELKGTKPQINLNPLMLDFFDTNCNFPIEIGTKVIAKSIAKSNKPVYTALGEVYKKDGEKVDWSKEIDLFKIENGKLVINTDKYKFAPFSYISFRGIGEGYVFVVPLVGNKLEIKAVSDGFSKKNSGIFFATKLVDCGNGCSAKLIEEDKINLDSLELKDSIPYLVCKFGSGQRVSTYIQLIEENIKLSDYLNFEVGSNRFSYLVSSDLLSSKSYSCQLVEKQGSSVFRLDYRSFPEYNHYLAIIPRITKINDVKLDPKIFIENDITNYMIRCKADLFKGDNNEYYFVINNCGQSIVSFAGVLRIDIRNGIPKLSYWVFDIEPFGFLKFKDSPMWGYITAEYFYIDNSKYTVMYKMNKFMDFESMTSYLSGDNLLKIGNTYYITYNIPELRSFLEGKYNGKLKIYLIGNLIVDFDTNFGDAMWKISNILLARLVDTDIYPPSKVCFSIPFAKESCGLFCEATVSKYALIQPCGEWKTIKVLNADGFLDDKSKLQFDNDKYKNFFEDHYTHKLEWINCDYSNGLPVDTGNGQITYYCILDEQINEKLGYNDIVYLFEPTSAISKVPTLKLVTS